MSAKKSPISFDEFVSSKLENFRLVFTKGFAGDSYRDSKAYRRCLAAHPKKFGGLASKLRRLSCESSEYAWKLYEAYRMMQPHAGKDWDFK